MCQTLKITKKEIKYFLYNNRFKKITSFLLKIYFQNVRIMQVKCIADYVDVNGYVVDPCECRLTQMNCNKRIDTCFKKKKTNNNPKDKIKILNQENLIRIAVNDGGYKSELCHCCSCCCFPLMVHTLHPQKIISSSGFSPVIHFFYCTNCKICKMICPMNAVDGSLIIDKTRCLGCGICWKNCAANAIEMVKSEEIVIKKPNRFLSINFYILFHIYNLILLRFCRVPSYTIPV